MLTQTNGRQGTRTRAPGARIGWIRAPRPSLPRRGPWAGDVAVGEWYAQPDLPAWINGDVRSPRFRLGVAIAALLILDVCHLVMVLAW